MRKHLYLPRRVDIELPADEPGFPAWLAAGAVPLLAALRALDADTLVWTAGADQHARFWPHRMLHEAVVHPCRRRAGAGPGWRSALSRAADGSTFTGSINRRGGDEKAAASAASVRE